MNSELIIWRLFLTLAKAVYYPNYTNDQVFRVTTKLIHIATLSDGTYLFGIGSNGKRGQIFVPDISYTLLSGPPNKIVHERAFESLDSFISPLFCFPDNKAPSTELVVPLVMWENTSEWQAIKNHYCNQTTGYFSKTVPYISRVEIISMRKYYPNKITTMRVEL